MKNYYTNILKASAILGLVSVLMLGNVSSLSAEEYKSMIRYDRVWECVTTKWFVSKVNYMRFDGTEEIKGKTYHRLITFKTAGFDWDEDPITLYDEVDGLCEHEGYLREEDGVVYTLAVDYAGPEYDYWGWMYVPSRLPDIDEEYIVEKVVYDFNRKVGESFEATTFCLGCSYPETFTVNSIDIVEIGGEQCRRYNLSYEVPVIESIGVDVYGCLNKIDINDMWLHRVLNRVFDLDGNLLFSTESEYADLPDLDISGVANIQTDTKDAEAPIFDVLGRRISAPAPGQLYIQNGKKHIAR